MIKYELFISTIYDVAPSADVVPPSISTTVSPVLSTTLVRIFPPIPGTSAFTRSPSV